MSEIINSNKLCDVFFDWMKKHFGVDDEDRFYILLDFVAPDECMWLWPEIQPDEIIDGKKYSTVLYETDFSSFNTFSNDFVFRFYRYTPQDGSGEELYKVKE